MATAVSCCAAMRPAAARCSSRRPARLAARAVAGAAGSGAALSNGNGKVHLETKDVGNSTNIRWHETMVSRGDKELLLGQRGCVLWFTGAGGCRGAHHVVRAVCPECPRYRV